MSSSSNKDDAETLHEKNRLLELENQLLHERLATLSEEISELKGETGAEQLSLELSTLKERIEQQQRKLFGDSSERRPSSKPPRERTQSPGHGPRPQEKLPRVETVVELDDADRVCPACAGELNVIEGATEDSELVDVIERKFIVRTVKRQKYRCQCNGAVELAPPPVKHIARGRYSLDFGAHVLSRKYAWHEPLDRQRRSMKEHGLEITTQTLWDQIDGVASKLEPVYDALREHIVSADVIGVDETWWRLMDRKAAKRWWVWAMQSQDAVYYRTAPSRSAETAAQLVGDFEGVILCDGYKAYETLAKRQPPLRLALCWSHVRRKFVEAEPNYPSCARAIELIGQLFEVDRETSDPTLLEGDAKVEAENERLATRRERAPPILEALRDWALKQRGLPKSSLRKAIDYMLTHWKTLQVFLDDPYVPLDNNATERALRAIVLGRKNHYGSRSVRGTEVAAIAYSLVETAKLNGLDPQSYIASAVYGAELGIPARELLPLRDVVL